MPNHDTTIDAPAGAIAVTESSSASIDTPARSKSPEHATTHGHCNGGAQPETQPVWDAFVRIFHWLLVAGVAALVASAHIGQQEIHMALGIAVVGLIAGRLVWGFIARNPFSRFASFAVSPFEAARYLGEIFRGHPRAYLGHNPAGAWMVFALLGLLSALALTGLALQATVEFEGPFVELLRGLNDEAVREISIAHRIFVNGLYLLVPIHLAGVALASIQHRENLVLAMVTGKKRLPSLPAQVSQHTHKE